MKRSIFLLLMSTLILANTWAQPIAAEEYVGSYAASFDTTNLIIIRNETNGLTAEFAGQGRASIQNVGTDRFTVSRVRPNAVFQFKRDDAAAITGFQWIQALPKFNYIRIPARDEDTVRLSEGNLSKYVGNYRLSKNHLKILKIRIDNGHLTLQAANEGKIRLDRDSDNRFVFVEGDLKLIYDFVPDKSGSIKAMNFSRIGAPEYIRTTRNVDISEVYGFNRPGGFTRADTLRGKLTLVRTCYDVVFYDLNVSVDPQTRSISGHNVIRFNATNSFSRMQVDLFAGMKIEKILFQGTPISFTRELNAVFIDLPITVKEGSTSEINIIYSGRPQIPDASSLAGGIFWLLDKEGEHWIQTVTQGSGASLWWPCKDHLSDKPDSMKISVTVPQGLTNISNGRLIRKVELPNRRTRFEWHVSYPIVNYGVTMNIGNYIHYSDTFISNDDTLALNYYCLAHDEKVARKIFRHTKPMVSVFEESFGKYPFWRDGFTVMESIYPMEHQSAVSIGPIFNPINSATYDSLDVIRTMWHECAHEWWGNSVTIKDMADLWIHEAFATYAEALVYEKISGREAMLKYLKDQTPENKEPILGTYDVNDFRLGDMYAKGVLLLHTLRNVIDDDSTWFNLLQSIQAHFAFQTISTRDLVTYINDETEMDFTSFFEQYITKAPIPILELRFHKKGSAMYVAYRWNAELERFNMRVKVTTTKNTYAFIYPTKDWKDMELRGMTARDFKVDTDNFYIAVKRDKRVR